MDGHQRIEEQSIWLHRAVAEKLRQDDTVLEKARERVEGWAKDASVHSYYANAWRVLLAMDTEEISRSLVDTSEMMRALRQVSPFAGALTPRERWDVLRRFREAYPR